MLVERGVPFRKEVSLRSRSPVSRSGLFRADIAVFKGDRPVALCECKARKRALRGRQRDHYEGSGLPYIIAGRENVDEAVDWLVATWMAAE